MDYSKSGVNIDLGDEASKILYDAAKATFDNRKGNIGEVIVPFDDFSGVRVIDVSNLPPGSLMCMGFDGVGTKVEIAQRMGDHSTIAFDLFAMVCDDAVLRGAEPVLMGSVLDVNSLGRGNENNIELIKQLADGYIKAAKEANVAVINGELAELGNGVGGVGKFKYNWCSGLVWFANKDRLITGEKVAVGDSIVVLEETGFRSNGLSLVRRVFEDKYGDEWHNTEFEGKKLGNYVLIPSKIYSSFIVHLNGGFQTEGCCTIHAVSHLTGGGIPGKLGRVLKPSGLGADLKNLFSPSKAMLHCQDVGEVKDTEAYKTWNMGQGMAIITPEPEKVIAEASKFGINAKLAGTVISEAKIKITSRGFNNPNKVIEF